MKKNRHIGSNLDDFLRQNGLLAKCEAGALKRLATKRHGRKLLEDFEDLAVIEARRGEPAIPHEEFRKQF